MAKHMIRFYMFAEYQKRDETDFATEVGRKKMQIKVLVESK